MMQLATAPLAVTVEIQLRSGPRGGERVFRLTRSVTLPASLELDQPLPIHGEGEGRVSLTLPAGQTIVSDARLFSDPEHPDDGSTVELLALVSEDTEAIVTYIEQRLGQQ